MSTETGQVRWPHCLHHYSASSRRPPRLDRDSRDRAARHGWRVRHQGDHESLLPAPKTVTQKLNRGRARLSGCRCLNLGQIEVRDPSMNAQHGPIIHPRLRAWIAPLSWHPLCKSARLFDGSHDRHDSDAAVLPMSQRLRAWLTHPLLSAKGG